jgi:hypothetical protein
VTAGAVAAKRAAAEEQHDDEEQNYDGQDDAEHRHPPWRARGVSAAGSCPGVVAGVAVGVRRRVIHPVPACRAIVGSDRQLTIAVYEA